MTSLFDPVIIAAGSVVTGEVPADSFATGNPGVVHKQIAQDEI